MICSQGGPPIAMTIVRGLALQCRNGTAVMPFVAVADCRCIRLTKLLKTVTYKYFIRLYMIYFWLFPHAAGWPRPYRHVRADATADRSLVSGAGDVVRSSRQLQHDGSQAGERRQ
jgi:hypothetical protein